MEPEKNNVKRIRTKLFYSTVALVVGIVVLAGATFAWFTLSTNPEIKGIKATVNTDRAIQISLDNNEYTLSKKLEGLSNKAPLIPVSTVDGLNWFICKYDVSGNVLQKADADKYEGTQFMYLRFPDGGNIGKSETKIVKKRLGNLSNQVANYYIWTDVYLKTEMGETDVYLSTPSKFDTEEGYEQQDTEKDHYGTYVLSYEYDEDTNSIRFMDKASNTAVRVGFMVLGEVEDGEGKGTDNKPTESDVITNPEYYFATSNKKTTGDAPGTKDSENIKDSNRFVIFEPNADSRSFADKSKEEFNSDLYVAGFGAQDFKTTGSKPRTYGQLDGYYLQTYPIRATDITLEAIKDVLLTGKESTVKPEGEGKLSEKDEKIKLLQQTFYGPQDDDPDDEKYKDTWKINGQDITSGGEEGKVDGVPSYFNLNNLTIQLTSLWNEDMATKELETTDALEDAFNTTMVGTIGKFLVQKTDPNSDDGIDLKYKETVTPTTLNNDYTAVDVSTTDKTEYRGYSKITTLLKDRPQKIRIYFWIEGQDVDCWNDISFTDFLVNLEFVGDVIKEEEETTSATGN